MKSKLILGMLLVGLAQCAGYLWALHGEHGLGYGCLDVDCYAQGARRIAEGHPFSYAPGLPPSTGQTSVLYPFVLSLFEGPPESRPHRIHTAAVALAVVFYLVFLAGWGVVIETLFPPNGPGRVISAALVALSPCCGYVAFTQCDQGLWMALSAVAAAALARRRWEIFLAALTLAPWVRPEGMMLVVATALFVGAAFLPPRTAGVGRQECRPNIALPPQQDAVGRQECRPNIALPLLSVVGVFALNYALTGQVQFSSVSEKCYFKIFAFVPALKRVLCDGLSILGSYLLSVPFPVQRLFTMPTPVASLGFWIGFVALVRCPANWKSPAVVFFLAAAMCVGTTSLGGFSGLDFDRYLAWLMPIPLLTAGYGLDLLAAHIRSPFWRKLPTVAAIMTTVPSTVGMVLMMHRVSQPRAQCFREMREEARHLPAAARVGSESFFWAYSLPDGCRYCDIMGIFTPDFRGCAVHLAYGQELLKHRKDLRFDYWAVGQPSGPRDNARNRDFYRAFYGTPLVPEAKRPHLYAADWSAYDRGAEAPDLGDGRRVVSRLDVCYRPDEKAAGMEAIDPKELDGYRFRTIGAAFPSLPGQGKSFLYDGGVPVTSGLAFSLAAEPGHAARLVLRTTRKVWFQNKDLEEVCLDYGASVRLNLSVDGVATASQEVPLAEDEYATVVFEIPAETLRSPRPRFELRGAFFACSLWLYQ